MTRQNKGFLYVVASTISGTLFASVRKVALAVMAVAGLTAAHPAFAASANADIAAPLRSAEASRSAAPAGDEEFRRLFSSWQSSNFASARTAAATTAPAPMGGLTPLRASIPSRVPLNSVAFSSSSYGMRNHPVLGGYRMHKGIDLPSPVGTPIYATADGVIQRADWFSGYGLYVAIEHGGAMETRYGHMSRIAVAAGQSVRKGDVIGYVGSTGRSTGPHLHYEVRVGGQAVNPMAYMTESGPRLAAADT
jgi:murein DD-endopeptidase MepM/ murein hydrolase activator NlpD